jgi:SAM-dependent methyltransferase
MPTTRAVTDSQVKEAVRDWWAASPMTYGTVHGQAAYRRQDGLIDSVTLGSREFFENVDRTFYAWCRGLHGEAGPFSNIFPYTRYRGKKVLEVGCGMGTMAMNWALQGADVTAVDLNPVAVRQTQRRFEIFGLQGRIQETDARHLPFEDQEFDYAYSWGVLYHSPDMKRSAQELIRVLKPGGDFGVMFDNRRSVYYWYLVRYLEGFLHLESKFLDPLELASRYTDGFREEGNPYTWPITPREAIHLFSPYSHNVKVDVGGNVEYPFPHSIRRHLPKRLRQAWSDRFGWTMWVTGTRTA